MRRIGNLRALAATGAILIAGALAPVRAQDSDDLQRAVARISLINGEVSVHRGDAGEWVAGIVNAPLLAEDQIATGANSRAEIQLDAANVLRIGGNAELRLTQLEYGHYQMELAHGTLTYNVVRASAANAEVDTPSIAIRPSKQGIYRVSVNDSGETEVTVRAGEVEVYSSRGSQVVQAGQSLMARGNANDAEFQMVAAIPYDDWDRWNADRDNQLSRAASYQYVPQGVYGAEDLDTYGSWGYVPPYGYCWHPTVALAPGWAPYRAGRWVWEDWYGWTWVSYDPWGWAPYHYGRWFWNAGGWWWYPGVIGRPHYWSPALVAFFGFGHGAGVGFGFGNIGWVPLGPYETFHPWWGRGYYGGSTYIDRSIHITNVNITNVYRNARVANGISGIPAGDFAGARFHNIKTVQATEVREAGLVRGQMPVGPTAQSLRFSDRSASGVPVARQNVRFFSRQQPSAVQRVPFAQQQRTFDPTARTPLPVQSAHQTLGNTSPRGAQNPGANGWRRFGAATPPQTAEAPQQRTPSAVGGIPENRGGWQRFGAPGRAPNQQSSPPARAVDPPGSAAGRYSGSRFASEGQQPLRVAPPVVRQRENANPPVQSAPRYQAPRYQSPPRYSAPRMQSAPRTQAPRTQSAPRSNGGGSGGGHANNSHGGRH